FHGKRVLSLKEIEEKYQDFIILLSFASSLDNVLDIFYTLNQKHEMYAPDVPVTGIGTFDLEFFNQHKNEIDKTRALLADELSVNVFDNVIKYKLTGKIDYLKEIETSPEEAWNDILSPTEYKICVDAGAYNGDTAREMLEKCPNAEKIYALEPDKRNFKKLSAFAENEKRVIPLNAAAWNTRETLIFDGTGNRNSNPFSNVSKKLVEIDAMPIDSICNSHADYIKYDVEGSEKEALNGSRETIKKSSPNLLVSLYHRNEDIFALPLLVNEFDPDYKLYIRKFKYVPAWDLNLYAVKK
ncbi:MAG: FkbM family methyltransferase, partial [Clostridia bacterium]|nr:FkbM family methyltransferase [Clostridia bacterium]